MKNTIFIAGGLLAAYGGYKLAKYNTSESAVLDRDKKLATSALLLGLSGMAYKFLW